MSDAFALSLADFLGTEVETPDALLGRPDDALLPRGGLVVIAGMPGAGKTTLAIDLVYHLAFGDHWLGFHVERPLQILVIENEGPRASFRAKLQRKHDAWATTNGAAPKTGGIHVHVLNWGAFTFRDSAHYNRLAEYLTENAIDVVVGDPLDTLGSQGVGSPEDTREFVASLVPLGLTDNRSFVFLHHFRKEVTVNEINQVSGAWGGRLDSLLVLRETDRTDQLRLSFPKLRWAESRQPMILSKVRPTHGYEVAAIEEPQVEPSAVEGMLDDLVETLTEAGGVVDRQTLVVRMGVDAKSGTFKRALTKGLNDGLLARGVEGRTTWYSLAPEHLFVEDE